MGNHDRAIQDYDQALELRPQYALAHYNRACAYSFKQEIDSIAEDLEKAVALDLSYKEQSKTDPDLAWARENIPEVRRLLGLDSE